MRTRVRDRETEKSQRKKRQRTRVREREIDNKSQKKRDK